MSTQVVRLIEQAMAFGLEEQLAVVSELSRNLLLKLKQTTLPLKDANQQLIGYVCTPDATPLHRQFWNESPEWIAELKRRSETAQPNGRSYDEVVARIKAVSVTN
jgi:hypothetical protein